MTGEEDVTGDADVPVADDVAGAARPAGEMRIDDLARAAGTTVRNVRAYQDRGLLPGPRRVGRVGWYNAGHVDRIRLIGSLLGRGYSLANIRELIDRWDHGDQLGDLLGLGQSLVGPFTDEVPDVGSPQDIEARYGLPTDDREAAAEVLRLGLIEIEGDDLRVPARGCCAPASSCTAPASPSATSSTSCTGCEPTSRPWPSGSCGWWCTT